MADNASAPQVRDAASHVAGFLADSPPFCENPLIQDAGGYETRPERVWIDGGRTVMKNVWLPVRADQSKEPVAYLPSFDRDGVFVSLHELRMEKIFGLGGWMPTGDVAALVGGARFEANGTQLVRRVRDSESGSFVDRLVYFVRVERSSSLWTCSVHAFEPTGLTFPNKRLKMGAAPIAAEDGVGEFVAVKKLLRNDRRIPAMLSILPMPDEIDGAGSPSDPSSRGRNHVLMVRDLFQVDGDEDHVYVVTPWCHNGELAGQFNLPGIHPTPGRWFRQLLDALHYLQSRRVCHRDLRPENILVDANRNIVLRGVGASSLKVPHSTENGQRMRRMVKPQERPSNNTSCMSPEVRDRRPFDGFAADLYSAGVVLYAMLKGHYPHLYPVEDGLADGLLYHILQAQHGRPTLSEVTKHPWVTKVTEQGAGGGRVVARSA